MTTKKVLPVKVFDRFKNGRELLNFGLVDRALIVLTIFGAFATCLSERTGRIVRLRVKTLAASKRLVRPLRPHSFDVRCSSCEGRGRVSVTKAKRLAK